MNNLHRELAPISDAAWSQIEEETSRTLRRYLAGRRVVDVQGPGGVALSAIGTGHLRNVEAPGEGILGKGDEETTGFTDYGIECLKQTIQVKKTRRPEAATHRIQ